MNDFFSQFKDEARKIRLTTEERVALRLRLASAFGRETAQIPRRSPLPSPFLIFNFRLVSSALVLALVVGSSVTYAAESAVPGDVLYPVKIHVTENFRDVVAVSDSAQVAWHTEAAERRIEEAEQLVAHGVLTEEKKIELQEKFDEHVLAAEELTDSLKETEPEVASAIETRFDSSVSSHVAIMNYLVEEDATENRTESDAFTEHVSRRSLSRRTETGRTMAALASEASFMAPAVSSADGEQTAPVAAKMVVEQSDKKSGTETKTNTRVKKQATSELKEVEKSFKKIKDKLSSTTSADVENRIAETRDLLESDQAQGGVSGDVVVETGADTDNQALRNAVMLNTFLKAQKKFKKEVIPSPVELQKKNYDQDQDWSREDSSESERRWDRDSDQ